MAAAVAAVWLSAMPAGAQAPASPSGAATASGASESAAEIPTEELERLIGELEDPEARSRLVVRLRALVAVRREGAGREEAAATTTGAILAGLSDSVRDASARIVEITTVIVDIPNLVGFLTRQARDERIRTLWLYELAKLAAVLLIGFGIERGSRLLLRRPRRVVEAQRSATLVGRILGILARIVLGLVPVAVFAVAGYVVLSFMEPARATRLLALAFINARVVAHVIVILARIVLTVGIGPLKAGLLGDQASRDAIRWVRRLAVLGSYGFFFAGAAPLLGLPRGTDVALLNLVGLALAAMVIIFIVRRRGTVASWIRAGTAADGTARGRAGLRARIAASWHLFAVGYVGAAYLVWALRVEDGFAFLARATVATVLVLAAAGFVLFLARRGVEHGVRLSEATGRRFPNLEERANRYLRVAHVLLRLAVVAAAAAAIAQAWGLPSLAWFSSNTGRAVLSSLFVIAVITALAVAVWEGSSLLVEHSIREAESHGAG
ncbi:MAG: hypothetical protein ACREGL_06160, partial [Alphaproteobacteria bacterium]